MSSETIPREPMAGSDEPLTSRLRWWGGVIVSTLIVSTAGVLLHFAYEWSGGSQIVALFAAVNESTWEHLKLAFWPALLLTPVQRRLYGSRPGWTAAVAIRCLLPSVLIVCGFYGYTALLGTHHVAADIGLFVISIFLGETGGHLMLERPLSLRIRAALLFALVAATLAFSSFTYFPPANFLFKDPQACADEPGGCAGTLRRLPWRLVCGRNPAEGSAAWEIRESPRTGRKGRCSELHKFSGML